MAIPYGQHDPYASIADAASRSNRLWLGGHAYLLLEPRWQTAMEIGKAGRTFLARSCADDLEGPGDCYLQSRARFPQHARRKPRHSHVGAEVAADGAGR